MSTAYRARDLTSLLMHIAEEAAQSAETDARTLATAAIRRFTDSQLRELAIREVIDWIDYHRRAEALKVERAAQDAAERKVEMQRAAQDADEEAQRRQRWYESPTGRYQDAPYVNAAARQSFKNWLGPRFDEWYQRAHAAAEALGEREVDFFESDWYPDGPGAYWRWRRTEHVVKLVNEVADSVRLETTERLLSTFFALGDGERVTWGEATIEQHEQRMALLVGNISGNVESAARHEAAIRMIVGGHVKCLNDLASSSDGE